MRCQLRTPGRILNTLPNKNEGLSEELGFGRLVESVMGNYLRNDNDCEEPSTSGEHY